MKAAKIYAVEYRHYKFMVKFERKGFKPYRRYFARKKEANADAKAFNDKLLKEGAEGQHIGARERDLLREIFAACERAGFRPNEVPALILRQAVGKRRRLADEIEACLHTLEKAGRAERTVKTLGLRLLAFARQCGREELREVTEADCREFIFQPGLSPQTQINHRRCLHQLFAYAVRAGHLTANPVTRIESPSLPRDQAPAILRPAEARIWFRRLEAELPAAIPYFALALFAGLRPSEIAELRPSDLSPSGIRVTGGKMRGRARRIVPRLPALDAWLAAYPPSWDWPANDSLLMRRGRALCPRPWKEDIPRHTWISARMAISHDENKTAREAGNSPAMIYAHYFETMSSFSAGLLMSITPQATQGRTSGSQR